MLLILSLAAPGSATGAPAFEPSPVEQVLIGGESFGYRTVGSGLARRIPNSQLRLFDDAGHAFLFQRNGLFAAVVERFLTR